MRKYKRFAIAALCMGCGSIPIIIQAQENARGTQSAQAQAGPGAQGAQPTPAPGAQPTPAPGAQPAPAPGAQGAQPVPGARGARGARGGGGRGGPPQPEGLPPRNPIYGFQPSAELREQLTDGLAALAEKLSAIEKHEQKWVRDLWPDVAIFHRAVDQALKFQEFASQNDLQSGPRLIEEGLQRAMALLEGEAPWTKKTGPVVLGFVSRLDNTVQPYGLNIPVGYPFEGGQAHRLDIWLHGRNDNVCEVNFINQQRGGRLEFSTPGAFVLSPFGRYSNAFRFAGEVDVFESLADVQRRYRVDNDRIAMRGFSMGGAGAWGLSLHYADKFFASNPGAGFSETAEFLGIFRARGGVTPPSPPWYEMKLWNLYDGPGYAVNVTHLPLVAYSGEIDGQKQAADVMEKALKEIGIDMVHIIGPQTGHMIHPDSKVEIQARLASIAQRGRQPMPTSVRMATYTLKYNTMHWVQIDALGQHWEQAKVSADIIGDSAVSVTTQNVNALTLKMPSGWSPLDIAKPVAVTIDGQKLDAPRPASDRSWTSQFHREGNAWKLGAVAAEGLNKSHNLQGPVDDAFMDSFLVVRPSGVSANAKFQQWSKSELDHAVDHWRQHFRGDARVKSDSEITDADIAASNLILFGDPTSNAVLAKIIDKLPIKWTNDQITVGQQQFATATHAPILIYPNPLNPKRYVVLNSGFTFREFDYQNNARQTPKIPDWEIVDISEPASNRYAGRVVAADFFDEKWQLKPPRAAQP